jgi:DNA-directed RNA polymerase II subunit RPB2
MGLKMRGRYMPYIEKYGIPVDIIINPNAVPSRMSIGQLKECQLATLGAHQGKIYDGTGFSTPDMEWVGKQLEKEGYAFNGHEIVRDGVTGKRYKCAIFVGFTYYQRLKHLVLDKVHARSRGRVQTLTRQPNEGRSKDGGLRIGEMERDTLLAAGLSSFLQECFMNKSDAFPIWVCNECKLFASYVPEEKTHRCTGCHNSTNISKVIVPAAFKLLVHELMAMSLLLRIETEKIDRLVSRRVNMMTAA